MTKPIFEHQRIDANRFSIESVARSLALRNPHPAVTDMLWRIQLRTSTAMFVGFLRFSVAAEMKFSLLRLFECTVFVALGALVCSRLGAASQLLIWTVPFSLTLLPLTGMVAMISYGPPESRGQAFLRSDRFRLILRCWLYLLIMQLLYFVATIAYWSFFA